jgi:hypothetical protein
LKESKAVADVADAFLVLANRDKSYVGVERAERAQQRLRFLLGKKLWRQVQRPGGALQ